MFIRLIALILVALLVSCGRPLVEPPVAPRAIPRVIVATPTPGPTPIPVTRPPESPAATTSPPTGALIEAPPPPALSPAGLALIYNYETGGKAQYERSPHPELPDLRLSGVTVGIGWDIHQYSKAVTMHDWAPVLPAPAPARLAETQPFYGRAAVEPWKQVRDILVPWVAATSVFLNNDVAREFAQARRAYPGFDKLSRNCQAALIANGFARGYGFTGANRAELRAIRELVPKRDYRGIAEQLRKQEHVWRGTSIYNGLKARVNAEAKLAETL